LAGPSGWAEQKRREGERVGARVGREREHTRVRLGQARGGEGEMTHVADFCFSFSKIWNSISFCLFQWNFCKAPKLLNIFVKPLCTVYYLEKYEMSILITFCKLFN
jgi:hypothetical protein